MSHRVDFILLFSINSFLRQLQFYCVVHGSEAIKQAKIAVEIFSYLSDLVAKFFLFLLFYLYESIKASD